MVSRKTFLVNVLSKFGPAWGQRYDFARARGSLVPSSTDY